MNEELLRKAKEAEDEKELIEMAEKEGIGLTEEAASSLFKRLHSPEGELPDDELGDIAGGGCITKICGMEFTTVSSACNCFTGKFKHNKDGEVRADNYQYRKYWYTFSSTGQCGHCMYLEFKNGTLGYCGHTGKYTSEYWENK